MQMNMGLGWSGIREGHEPLRFLGFAPQTPKGALSSNYKFKSSFIIFTASI